MPISSFYGSNETKKIGKHKVPINKDKKVRKRLGKGFIIFLTFILVFLGLVYFVMLRPVFSLMSDVKSIRADVKQIQDNLAKRDLVALEEDFDQLELDLEQLRMNRDKKIKWAASFPPTKNYYSDSDHFIDAGLHVVDAGREVIVLVVPFADAGGFKVAESQEVEEIGLMDAFSQWISIMPVIAEDIDPVLEYLALAGKELEMVDANRYPKEIAGQPIRLTIEGAQKLLGTVNEAGPDIKKALVIIPPLLGVDTVEKRYMIMMQNDKEIRATGGFWTYFSTFKLNNAMLTSDFTSYGTYNIDFTLDAIDAYYTFPTVPPAYNNHLKVERMFARDANISPDFPTSVDQFMDFWELATPLAPAQFKPIDGIFTIDTVVLEELLEVTGPVALNGVEYNSDTVTLELEKIASLALREQANRKKILGDLMFAMLNNVFESDKNLWPKLVDKGIDLTRRKHVQAWVFDEEAQVLLEKYNLAGRIVDPIVGDYAYVVSTNLGGGKTNEWFVSKDVTHTLSREGDRYIRAVEIEFTYDGEEKGPEFAPFKVPYHDWVRLYVPLGSELIEAEGSAEPIGEDEERNKTYFHGFIHLSPGESKTLTFRYYLPDEAVSDNTYKLYIQKQSGIETETHSVSVLGETKVYELETDKRVEIGL
jgi:hypothetical protein